MKKTILFFILALITFGASATLRRVNNNSGIIAVNGLVYTTLDAAIGDAVAGDTIYVEPSTINYSIGSALTKRLIFIGDGYSKGSNANLISPLSFNLNSSVITSNFSINAGAENSAFIGMVLNSLLTVNANNILFKRCSFLPNGNAHNVFLNSNNNIIEQCFFQLGGSGHHDVLGSGSGNIFKNCIMQDILANQINPLVDQCVLGGVQSVTNGVFTNCIVGTNTFSGVSNCTFSFSIKVGNAFGTPGSNNIENASFNDIIETVPASEDKHFRLKSGSIALGVGNTGQNIGPFGGADPYRLSGMAGIPIIRNFFLSTTGSAASGLSGSITIQSNN